MRRQITADFSKSVEQHRKHRVDLHQGLRRWCESLAEPLLEQAIKELPAAGDHAHGHVPGGVTVAVGGGRLMITDENHHEVTAGVEAEVAGESGVNVIERLCVAG